jgi:hypothetical protein
LSPGLDDWGHEQEGRDDHQDCRELGHGEVSSVRPIPGRVCPRPCAPVASTPHGASSSGRLPSHLLGDLPAYSGECTHLAAHAVTTVYPLGNCDSLRPETLLSYLIRLGTVSNRPSPPSSFFACTDGPRRPPEELVNSASSHRTCARLSEEPRQPA